MHEPRPTEALALVRGHPFGTTPPAWAAARARSGSSSRTRGGRGALPLPYSAGSGYRGGIAREIRIEISDEAYEALERVAAEKHMPAEDYAGRVLDADLTRARFVEGARSFVAQHGQAFAKRFGRPADAA
ncbi:hypothetical protein [Streptomyces sp. bgisy082]|uniref:hypothetical protein n=1 Tax=Streptomyces sp. bgisy082 TaxID=3413776 RepID=UPI003D7100BC